MNAQPADFLQPIFFGDNSVGELRAHLAAKRPRMVFIRWNAAPDENSWGALEEWVGKLESGRKLMKLSHRPLPVTDALLLEEFFNIFWATFCPKNLHETRKRDVLSALKRVPYSELLEQAVLGRLVRAMQEADERNRLLEPEAQPVRPPTLALATFESGASADQRVRKVLGWIRQLGLTDPVLIFGRERTTEERVQEYRFSRNSLFKDVAALFQSLEFSLVGTPATTSQPRRILEVLSAVVERILGDDGTGAKSREDSLPIWQNIQEEWAYLIARLAAPNFTAVHEIAVSWHELEKKIELWSKELAELGWLRPDNAEEYYTFRVRLGFLVMLRTLHPKVYQAAAFDPDGADHLYRFHLILLGETNSDSLVASALLPAWQEWLREPLLCELFQSCFNPIRGGLSLVPRFESRLQLRNLLLWLSEHSEWPDAPPRNDALSDLVRMHRDWVVKVANTKLGPGDKLPSYDELGPEAEKLLDPRSSASDALQAAQILLSADELYGKLQSKRTFDELVTTAIRASRGGIRFDAMLTQARALALAGKPDSALQILRIEKRRTNDSLMRLAADIEIAFAYECERSLFQALALYQRVLKEAENVGADELVARAVNGCLRCDMLTKRAHTTQTQQLRAQIMLRIQSARSTELSPLRKRDKPKLFLSYRSKERFVTASVHEGLIETKELDTYYDQVKDEGDDFSPAIHTSLLDSDAVVLVLSEEFFNSPWCIHELHFALGQCDVRGVMLFWVWCAAGEGESNQRCEDAVREWIERRFPSSELCKNGYDRAHVEDRVKRLFSYGKRITEMTVHFDPKPTDEEKERQRLKSLLVPPIKNYIARLYERAHLEYVPARSL